MGRLTPQPMRRTRPPRIAQDTAMDAEQLNQIETRLEDLSARTAALRGYL
jgi:hypothetical protein